MTERSKLEAVLSLRQLEEEISKARLAQSVKGLEQSRQAVESAKAGLETFRVRWREAVETLESVEQLKLFPTGREQLRADLKQRDRVMENSAQEVEARRAEYAERHRTRQLLESLVERRLRHKALLQEVREQNEWDEQVLLGSWP